MKVIICETDGAGHRNGGAIIMEQYTRLSDEAVIGQAANMAGAERYGRVWTAEIDESSLSLVVPFDSEGRHG